MAKEIIRRFGHHIMRVIPYGLQTSKEIKLPPENLTGRVPTTTEGSSTGTGAVSNYLAGTYMIASKTYNPNHSDYDANLVKNYPGCFNDVVTPTERTESSRRNKAFRSLLDKKLLALCGPNPNDYDFLARHTASTYQELVDDEGYRNLLERNTKLDEFISYLNAAFPGQYYPGNVSLEDAMFLYYIVRLLQPKTIVQTGVSNGFSTAHMCLALKANGQGGRLYAIDIPVIYNENDPEWHQGRAYGVVIPTGKSSGWLVPDSLRSSFQCWTGDTKDLLPALLDRVGTVDLFYHDSDHTYDHVWFELTEVLPHMREGGVIIVDDIAWSSAAWNFAAQHGCYAFNHRGSQGVVFL